MRIKPATASKLTKTVFFENYFLYFMMYSIIGWIYEVFLHTVVYRWGFVNRGVLFGPYCPVYGVGAMVFLLFLHRIMAKKTSKAFVIAKPFIIFICCMAIATLIELVTTYILEGLIGSWPWQSYSRYAFNFQARIALNPSVRFGIGGTVFLYVLQPLFEKATGKMSPKVKHWVAGILLVLILTDLVIKVING